MSPLDTQEHKTRWGNVSYAYRRLDETYSEHTYEGPAAVVIVEVAERLKSVTQCYEHMFSVFDVQRNNVNGWLRVRCQSSNYAGD